MKSEIQLDVLFNGHVLIVQHFSNMIVDIGSLLKLTHEESNIDEPLKFMFFLRKKLNGFELYFLPVLGQIYI